MVNAVLGALVALLARGLVEVAVPATRQRAVSVARRGVYASLVARLRRALDHVIPTYVVGLAIGVTAIAIIGGITIVAVLESAIDMAITAHRQCAVGVTTRRVEGRIARLARRRISK